MKTRGVLFDLYGTLIVYGEMDKAWNAWFEVIYESFRDNGLSMSRTEFRPFCSGFFERPEPQDGGEEITVVERRLQRLAREVSVPITRPRALLAIEKSIDVWHGFVHLDPDAIHVLKKIRSSRSVALVSNFDYAPYVHRLLDAWGLEPLFDTVIVSDAVGVKKPHPGIFEQALNQLGLSASEAVHIGDSREDIEGACSAGIRPVWIDRRQKDRWRAQPSATVTCIGSLSEILALLD